MFFEICMKFLTDSCFRKVQLLILSLLHFNLREVQTTKFMSKIQISDRTPGHIISSQLTG